MPSRTNWYSKHPPACTCKRCYVVSAKVTASLSSIIKQTLGRLTLRQYMLLGSLKVVLIVAGIVAFSFLSQDEVINESEVIDLTAEPIPILRPTVGRPPPSLDRGKIVWGDTQGRLMQSAYAGETVSFFIKDETLETIKSGTAVFTGQSVDSTLFNIATGAAGPNLDTMSEIGVTRVLNADFYDTSNPNNTPLVKTPEVYRDNESGIFVSYASLDDGVFGLISTPKDSKSVTAHFDYHIVDVGLVDAVKITSTSDLEGEWVTIEEIEQYSLNPSATSQIFFGYVYLSPDELTNGSNNDGVWVQIGDTVTATYFGSTGIEVTTLTIK